MKNKEILYWLQSVQCLHDLQFEKLNENMNTTYSTVVYVNITVVVVMSQDFSAMQVVGV